MTGSFINVGLAVNDIHEAARRFEETFGWKLRGEVTPQPALGISFAMLDANGLTIELLSPLPGETTLRRFLDTRGEGIYRLAFGADDLDADLARLAQANVSFVDVSGPAGKEEGRRIVFTHPKAAHGLMLELVEGHD
ncbi:MAG: VOC family protein [Dehalococcoidia bacterium]|nr:VOC family protein [Dehalococcoidia bacterium]